MLQRIACGSSSAVDFVFMKGSFMNDAIFITPSAFSLFFLSLFIF